MNIYQVSDFPKTFLTADIVLWRKNRTNEIEILLIKRLKDPYKDQWALPGGFFDIDLDEKIENAAQRELEEETSLKLPLLDFKLVGVFSKRHRDPRESIASEPCRIVSTAFKVEAKGILNAKANDDASDVKWFPLKSLPSLAFDHDEIIETANLLR